MVNIALYYFFCCTRYLCMKKVFDKNKKNIEYIKQSCNQNKDLVVREFFCGGKSVAILFLNEEADQEKIEKFIIKPMITFKKKLNSIDEISKKIIYSSEIEMQNDLDECVSMVLKGNTLIFLEGSKSVLIGITLSPAQRSVEEPPSSAVIYGPREGFTETIKTNIGLIRKRLPTTALKIEELNIGTYTKNKVMICYLNDVADTHVVEKIKRRLEKIEIDGVIDAHYLISFLEEKKGSIFKQVGKTEKPDIAVAKILEGRVAILVDNSPIVLTLPFVVFEDLQNSDDYYQRSFRVGIVRFLRVISLFMSILLPGLYVAIQLYHYRIIPLKFLVSIINSSQGIPFTPFLEMIFVIVLFEILFEASLRMPKYIGMALSVVGALVLGDTAVKAGLISSPAVMIIALTGISFYTIPDQTSQISILRLLFTLVGGMVGLFGIIIAGTLFITYLVEFNAYGAPYLAPYAPYIKKDLKDGIFKQESISLDTRPKSIPNQKKVRKSNRGGRE